MEVEFPEAVFTIHYTKGFRESYPIPLPTTVAGIFGAMLGIKRRDMQVFTQDKMFGAKMVRYKGMVRELFTYLKYRGYSGKGAERVINVQRGVGLQTLVNNPRYMIAMASEDEKGLIDILDRLDESLCFLPYGGMNDHPATDVKIYDKLYEVDMGDTAEGYAPESVVEDIYLDVGGDLYRYPVKYRGSMEYFYFVVNGKLKLVQQISKVFDIPLYTIDDYLYQVI